jgi:HK97 family phage major capsid protein
MKMDKNISMLPGNIGEVFDDDQKEVLVNLEQAIKDTIENRFDENTEAYIDEALKRRNIDSEIFGLNDQERALLGIKKAVAKTRQIWDSNGFVPGVRERISIQDLAQRDIRRKRDWANNNNMVDGVFSTDQPLIIPRVIEEMIREPIEPTVALTPLLQRINVSNAGTTISFPAVGDAMVAADIAEGAEYPESSLEFAGQVTAKIGKSGIAAKLSEEMIRYSMYDVMGMHIRAAGRALVRHKERKVASLIFNNGVTVFDNSASGYHTSGRGSDGNGNKTMTLDDILIMYADMVNEGFIPNTMIVHPFSWFGFVRDPVMRHLFLNLGQGNYYQNFEGNVGSAPSFSANNMINSTTLGTSSAGASSDNVAQVATTYVTPGILPVPMRVIVTPYQEANITSRNATITLADSSRLGMLLVDEEVTTDEFEDVLRDLYKIKFRERYGLALHDNGQAIRHAKGVNWWNRSYNLDDMLTWEAGTGVLPTLSGSSVDIV